MNKILAEPNATHPLASAAMARNLERVAWLMDRAVKIPGTKITVGLDAILGLFPVGGDVLTGFVQAGLVLVALRHYRVPKAVAARMAGNVLLDIAVGSIPLLGDLFDVAFKANTRNLELLKPFQPRLAAPDALTTGARPEPKSSPIMGRLTDGPGSRGTSWRLILPIAVALAAALTLMIIGLIAVIRWLL